MFDIQEELKKLPESPGVYLMYDIDDACIYVGKAIILKNRVRSYFRSDKNQHPKVKAMVSHVVRFEYIIVGNEVEALILESNLIKDKKPKYNILLRDDKSYPYIKVINEKYPRIVKTRRVLNDGARYYGPYPNAYAVNEIVDLLVDVYKLRTCNLDFEKGQRLKRPCLNYYIDKCPAPCVDKANEMAYNENVFKAEDFLKGKTKGLTDYLESEMKENSSKLNFELAAKYRDYLEQVNILNQKQRISKASGTDIDLIALARGDRHFSVRVFFMRAGKVVDSKNFIIDDDYNDDEKEIMTSFIKQFYLNSSYVPKEILLDVLPDEIDLLVDFLSEKRGNKVAIRVPHKGEKFDLLKVVKNNAKESLNKYEDKIKKRDRQKPLGFELLIKSMKLENIHRLESYDISNISGVQSVGSMVVFTDGKKDSKEYRKFKIKTVEGPNDYASMREVLTRRFSRWLKEREDGGKEIGSDSGFSRLPDLILMDGGKGQISIAEEVLAEFKLSIPVCGLVKDDNHNTRGIIFKREELKLEYSSPIYRFVFQIQEEAHRFAINYHRKLRSKDQVASTLDSIDGIGKMKRTELLKHFKSIEKIKNASLEELIEVPGIGKSHAKKIIDYFQDKDK